MATDDTTPATGQPDGAPSGLRERAQHLLRRYGPLSPRELHRLLTSETDDADGAEGLEPLELYRLLLDDDDPDAFAAFPLFGGELCDLDHLLDGLTLTHVITDDERQHGELDADTDLAILGLCSPDGRTVPVRRDADSGEPADRIESLAFGPDGLAFPDGWLPDTPALAVTIHDRVATIRGLAALPDPDPTTADRLAHTAAILDDQEWPFDVAELLVEARARFPRLLDRPQAPVTDLLTAADLYWTEHGTVSLDDPDLDEVFDDGFDELYRHLEEDHGFDDEEVHAIVTLVTHIGDMRENLLDLAVERLSEQGPEAPLEELMAANPEPQELISTVLEDVDTEDALGALAFTLADLELTAAVREDVIGSDEVDAVCLQMLLELTAGILDLDRHESANAAWLRATIQELIADDHSGAERELRRAVELDRDHAPAAYALAEYLSDRGQAGAALGLLRELEGPDVDDLTELLAPFTRPGPASAGRNDPCPCGSGRKHKVCCQGRGGWPLQSRIPWVWHKLNRFAGRPSSIEVLRPIVAASRVTSTEPDVAVINLSLFEGGLIGQLCDRRGALLPADELAMLREWAQVRARVYEVVERGDDHTLTFLDLTSGERTELVDRSLSRSVELGDALLAWLTPEPRGPVVSSGVVRIPDHRRGDALELIDREPEALEIASWYGSLLAPPALATTAGDPLVQVTEVYDVPDTDAAWEALADHLEADGETLVAHEHRDGTAWLRGSVVIDDGQLRVETMSVQRARWFADLITEVVPDAQLVDASRLPIGESGPRDGEGEDEGGGFDLDALDPDERRELEAELNAMMEAHEDRWVDESIPALDGATPRDAVNDPTRRDRVLRLLDEIERHAANWSSPGRPMDADRLRSLLGL